MPQATDPSRTHPAERRRLIILANMRKQPVVEALRHFRPWLEQRANVMAEQDTSQMSMEQAGSLPAADLAIVLGGDGTMLAQARVLSARDLPLLGINFGKVGFLAEFTLDAVKSHWDSIIGGTCPTSTRMMVEVLVYPRGSPEWGDGALPAPLFRFLAMNDAVITAGAPYRMVEIELAIEPSVSHASATTFIGDGVIVATPAGSTAYNLAAGGAIVSPGVDGLCITAICPYSLSARPIICHSSCEIWLAVHRANEGTELVIDGQDTCRLDRGQQILVRKHTRSVRLLHNPDYHYWNMLAHKMHWAVRPRRG